MDGGLPDLEGKKTQSVGESLGREGKGSKEGSKELLAIEALLELGSLEQEEKFDGDQANETVFLCYSSVCLVSFLYGTISQLTNWFGGCVGNDRTAKGELAMTLNMIGRLNMSFIGRRSKPPPLYLHAMSTLLGVSI